MKFKYYWKRRYKTEDKWHLWYKDCFGDHMTNLSVRSAPWFELYFGENSYGNVPKKLLLRELKLPDYEEIWTEHVDCKPMALKERVSLCAEWKKKILKAVQGLSNRFS